MSRVWIEADNTARSGIKRIAHINIIIIIIFTVLYTSCARAAIVGTVFYQTLQDDWRMRHSNKLFYILPNELSLSAIACV